MRKTNLKVIPGKTKSQTEDDVDALFRLPLSEFISARKTLAIRLKQEARSQEADQVKVLVKPSISAWAANQLYWEHRELFDQLIATGERIRQAQTGRAGKTGDLRNVLDERREVLSELSDVASRLLREAGNNPALDTLRRITTTLEAMTAYATLPTGVFPGRLTRDIDPPGFDSLASFAPPAGSARRVEAPARVSNPIKSGHTVVKTQPKFKSAAETKRRKEARQAELGAAKASLQKAKKSLVAARTTAQRLEATQKKADAEAREAEQQRRDAERRFKNASAVSETATKRSRNVRVDMELAKKAVDEAHLAVQRASAELESLFRES